MEHGLYRWAEIATAGQNDKWIASSKYIRSLYIKAGIIPEKIYLSYYGIEIDGLPSPTKFGLREHLGYRPILTRLWGMLTLCILLNITWGQLNGLKRHENVIDALGIVCDLAVETLLVCLSGVSGEREPLTKSAYKNVPLISLESALNLPDGFLHLKRLEPRPVLIVQCMYLIERIVGVLYEPLAYEVPVIASSVGGLPEVVLDGATGWVVPVGNPKVLADTIEIVLDNPQEA